MKRLNYQQTSRKKELRYRGHESTDAQVSEQGKVADKHAKLFKVAMFQTSLVTYDKFAATILLGEMNELL